MVRQVAAPFWTLLFSSHPLVLPTPPCSPPCPLLNKLLCLEDTASNIRAAWLRAAHHIKTRSHVEQFCDTHWTACVWPRCHGTPHSRLMLGAWKVLAALIVGGDMVLIGHNSIIFNLNNSSLWISSTFHRVPRLLCYYPRWRFSVGVSCSCFFSPVISRLMRVISLHESF